MNVEEKRLVEKVKAEFQRIGMELLNDIGSMGRNDLFDTLLDYVILDKEDYSVLRDPEASERVKVAALPHPSYGL